MNPKNDVSLKNHSTMALGGNAKYFVEISSKEQLESAVTWAKGNEEPFIVIGGGSNIVWKDEGFSGLVIENSIKGLDIIKTESGADVTVAAGEDWDEVVEQTVELGLSGIEAMSLVPGKVGATPVQNVGAYGQEISDTLVSLEAYDTMSGEFIRLDNRECEFGYRASRFKGKDKGRFVITSIELKLSNGTIKKPLYSSLERYLDANNISDLSPKTIREAVINIRSSKLPDPKIVHNCGSFFANPLISEDQLADLNDKYEDVPSWPSNGNMIKISAAWLIEHAGYKDYHDKITGMSTWPTQALVLVNESAENTSDLLAFKREIVGTVEATFGLKLVQEPELLP
jgi:UDP-N-acetylmuramate dehydrogenase